MAEPPIDSPEALRATLLERLARRSHWLLALIEAEWDLTTPVLGAIDAAQIPGGPRLKVDCWDLSLIDVDPDTGVETAHGTLRLLSWPRRAPDMWAPPPGRGVGDAAGNRAACLTPATP